MLGLFYHHNIFILNSANRENFFSVVIHPTYGNNVQNAVDFLYLSS